MISLILEKIAIFDKLIFSFINHQIKDPILDIIFPLITHLGETSLVIVICIILFLFNKKKNMRVILLLLTATFFSRIIVFVLKHITDRPRPIYFYDKVNLLGSAGFSSFPSGHTALATAVAIILSYKFKKLSWLLVTLTILVGISRIYMGQHYPTDVIVGFICGIAAAIPAILLDNLYQKNIP